MESNVFYEHAQRRIKIEKEDKIMPDQWLEDQNQKINALMDWIEEQQALAGLFPVDPYLVELAEGEMITNG
jgi:hypothetical protein